MDAVKYTNLNVGSEFELEAVPECGRVVLVAKVRSQGELPAAVVADAAVGLGMMRTGGRLDGVHAVHEAPHPRVHVHALLAPLELF